MAEPEDDLVVLTEPIPVHTSTELEEHPELIAGQNKAKEGILDDEDPEFEAHEMEAAEDLTSMHRLNSGDRFRDGC
jgi:hypothetical protein